jgi:ribokinase
MIVCFGSVNLDLIFPVDALPRPGETTLSPMARLEPGGKGANQACAAARDGASVVMVGAVGDDPLADAALAGLAAAGADITRVARVHATTGCAAICVDANGQNQIAVASGANLLARADQVEDALLGPGTTLLLQMEVDPAETAALIRRARRAMTRVILNLAPARELATDALEQVDLLICNGGEAEWLGNRLGTAWNAGSIHDALGVSTIVTHGVQGSEYAALEGRLMIDAYEVDVADTTAAGDCFTGVLAAALDRGLPAGEAIRRANLAGALCCTRVGTQASLPTRVEVDALIDRSPEPTMSEPEVRD